MLADISFETLLAEVKQLPLSDETITPFAFFDADHTLWAGDLGDLVAREAMKQGLMKPKASHALAEILKKSGGVPTMNPNRDSQLLLERYFKDKVSDLDIIIAQVLCYAGWTPSELRTFGKSLFDKHLAPKIYEDMAVLHETLRKAGITIKVISGSAQWIVEAACEHFGIPAEDVYGARSLIVDGLLSDQVDEPMTYTAGKVEAMERWIGSRTATIAFGDSKSDYPMQERCVIRVAVNPRPGVRKYAAANEPQRWRLWVPEYTRDRQKVSRIESDRIITE
jgi:HAD superfamily phosphoserine phosphatase-like hydrolase